MVVHIPAIGSLYTSPHSPPEPPPPTAVRVAALAPEEPLCPKCGILARKAHFGGGLPEDVFCGCPDEQPPPKPLPPSVRASDRMIASWLYARARELRDEAREADAAGIEQMHSDAGVFEAAAQRLEGRR